MSFPLYQPIRVSCLITILVSNVAGSLRAEPPTKQRRPETGGTGIPVALVTPQTALAIAAHPQRVLMSPNLQYLPIEVLSALAKRELGVDPHECEWVLAVAELPPDGPPEFGFIARFATPIDIGKLSPKLTAGMKRQLINGHPYFQSTTARVPSILLPDVRTLAVVTDDLLRRMNVKETQPSPVREIVRQAMVSNDFAAVFAAGDLHASIRQHLEQLPLPPAQRNVVQRISELVQFAELSGNVTTKLGVAAVLHTTDESAAIEAERLIGQSLQQLAKSSLLPSPSEVENRLSEPSATIRSGDNPSPDAAEQRGSPGLVREVNRLVVRVGEEQLRQSQSPHKPAGPSQSSADGRLLSLITPQTVFGAVLRPQRFLMYADGPRLEMKTALGFDPASIETALLVIEPRTNAMPQAGIVARFAGPFTLNSLSPRLKARTSPAKLSNGRDYLRCENPDDSSQLSFFMADDRTLIAASDELLRRMARQSLLAKPPTAIVRTRLARAAVDQDLALVLELTRLHPLIHELLQQLPPFPPELESIRRIPELIQFVEYRTSLERLDLSLNISTANAAAANTLSAIIGRLLDRAERLALDQIETRFSQDRADPVELAWSQYFRRSTTAVRKALRPNVATERLVLEGRYTVPGIATAVALVLPAVNAARVAAARNQSAFQAQRIAAAWMDYEKARGKFPARANFDAQGKSLLSWRVHLLPFLGEQELFNQFHLNETWDSPHNRTLIAKMPEVYATAGRPLDYKTTFLLPVGKGTLFEGTEEHTAGDIADGRDRTIIFAQANGDKAVTWTSPMDLDYAPANPMSGLGALHPDGLFIVALADGQVQSILSRDISTESLRSLFTFAGRD